MADAPRCETCKHWVEPPTGFSDGQCRRVAYNGSDGYDSLDPAPMALSSLGTLFTIAAFGCVLHEGSTCGSPNDDHRPPLTCGLPTGHEGPCEREASPGYRVRWGKL
jgi:hypothetical protein